MGCPVEKRMILINHDTGNVNISAYTSKRDDKMIKLYDDWNPYKNLFNNLI